MDHMVDCDGIAVHYEDHGTGTPIVLLHGGLVNARMMWGPHIEAFSAAHRVLAPDTRGHGRTDNPAGSLSYEHFADDTAAFIAALGLERPVVVGYSDGAQTALELALRHPGAAGAVVLGGIVVEHDEDYAAMLESLGMAVPGQVDADTAAFAQAHRIVKAVAGAELAVLPGADHGGAIARPLFAHDVLDFVERVVQALPAED